MNRNEQSSADAEPFDTIDPERILSGQSGWIGPDSLEHLSRHPLECVETEYPHYVGSTDGPDGIERPTENHPVFYGCFDWHSAVHGHWCLVRQLRLFDDHPAEAEIVRSLESRFTTERVEVEAGYVERNPSFEKPYGWAWLLRLAAELSLYEDGDEDGRADDWREVLEPLEERIVELVETKFLSRERPHRTGAHRNSAFALQGVIDYARVTSNGALESAATELSREFYAADEDYPVEYEPLGWDFLSPSLVEADLMRRVLGPDEFASWIDGFLPDVTSPPYETILDPVEVPSERDEEVEIHLAGLNLSKAWCLAGIASALDGHRYADPLERSAARHAERGLERAFTGEYAGAHWLSSFALYLLTRNEGAIAPDGSS